MKIQSLFFDLSHEDIRKQRGYGPRSDPSVKKKGEKHAETAGETIIDSSGIEQINPTIVSLPIVQPHIVDGVTEIVGKMTGNQDTKDCGDVIKDTPEKKCSRKN
ncbi:hypothetical protein RclHR1_06130007 [Rhizophagus clarus]|uniref:Uncharacterized protein n=1 Tax=Rhizophagus clarus TaxID=94130 RepID=A0A2Z6RQU4_9GLOM|nr:hypothetical protein RclHR1_06130007 [Rhizophagus clarus]GES73312.1 hypothetical protein GLOIN_2v1477870 [Rhizophagus clarus]